MGGSLYAYPLTADNGYFLYYNKAYFSEEDIQSLERMLELAERSASGDCSDASRVRLQQGLEILREQIDRALERYQDH